MAKSSTLGSNQPVSSTSLQPGLQRSGDYAIQTLSIVTSDGTVIDIRSHAVELNLYEDIFSPCMNGSILMGDAQSLVDNFKLQGNEWLILNVDKPGLKQPISKTFRIYKISERQFKSGIMQNYVLHFCSEEMFLNTQYYVSKAYQGMSISDMIKDVLTNKLGAGSKTNFWDKTDGLFNIVVPRMHPLETIQWLSSRAYSSNGSLFLFYETRDGYNFESYESMIKRPIYKKYTYSVKDVPDPTQTNYKLNYLKIQKDFDILETGQYGGFVSNLLFYDVLARRMYSNRITVADMPILNDSVPVNQTVNRFKTPILGADYFIKVYPMTDSDPTVNPSQPYNWLHQKALRLAQMYSFKMIVSITGDVLLKAGSVIDVEIPTAQIHTPSGSGDAVAQTRSGSFLITAVHHLFINDMMTTVMELVSDSVVGELIASNDGSSSMQKIKKS